jgi:high-affinity Fe2+/Pb2+ permease
MMAQDTSPKLSWIKWIIGILIGTSIGIVIGFSVYHYFFMERFSCCGIYG